VNLKKFFRRYMPEHRAIREHKHLNRVFGKLLHDPNLLHLNRRSVSMAFLIGLFWAFMPTPFQMIPAAAFAILLRANLPLSVGLVWISNPITIPPIFYFCYELGAWLLNTPPHDIQFELNWDWLMSELGAVWEPLLLGCLVVGLVSGLTGFITVRLLWRLHIVRFWKRRKLARLRARRPRSEE
jgi:uncharacterized protein (DUF2062 family)